MQPNLKLITINDNVVKIKELLTDLVLLPRLKALEWSKITKQTPNMKVGYPGQHLASLVLGMEGTRTGARGHDIVDGSEVKSCSRVDQLDKCKSCDERVSRAELICPTCSSDSIKRMDDSKWLFTIKNENDLKVLTEDIDRIVLTLADYPNFRNNDFETIRFQVFEIWNNTDRCKFFKILMKNYYENIYIKHKEKDPQKTPAPKNFWPYQYQFYMCNPIKVFSALVKNANTKPSICIESYIKPDEDRANLQSEPMPSTLLNPKEWNILLETLPTNLLAWANNDSHNTDEFNKRKLNKKDLSKILPLIKEELRNYLPLRDTDKISESKESYVRGS